MLGALAAIALIVGGVSTTMVLTEDERLAAEETREPVVEVQTITTAEAPADEFGF
jgi:hypothetical protein